MENDKQVKATSHSLTRLISKRREDGFAVICKLDLPADGWSLAEFVSIIRSCEFGGAAALMICNVNHETFDVLLAHPTISALTELPIILEDFGLSQFQLRQAKNWGFTSLHTGIDSPLSQKSVQSLSDLTLDLIVEVANAQDLRNAERLGLSFVSLQSNLSKAFAENNESFLICWLENANHVECISMAGRNIGAFILDISNTCLENIAKAIGLVIRGHYAG